MSERRTETHDKAYLWPLGRVNWMVSHMRFRIERSVRYIAVGPAVRTLDEGLWVALRHEQAKDINER